MHGLWHTCTLAILNVNKLVEENLVVLGNADVLHGGYIVLGLLPVDSLLGFDFHLRAYFVHLWHRLQVLQISTRRRNLLQLLLVLLHLATNNS